MSLRDQILGQPDAKTSVASAIKAVESAQAALESAYLSLVTVARGLQTAELKVSDDPSECEHPHHLRINISTMGVNDAFLCEGCGGTVSGI